MQKVNWLWKGLDKAILHWNWPSIRVVLTNPLRIELTMLKGDIQWLSGKKFVLFWSPTSECAFWFLIFYLDKNSIFEPSTYPSFFDHVVIERPKVYKNMFHADKQLVILCLLWLLSISSRFFNKYIKFELTPHLSMGLINIECLACNLQNLALVIVEKRSQFTNNSLPWLTLQNVG